MFNRQRRQWERHRPNHLNHKWSHWKPIFPAPLTELQRFSFGPRNPRPSRERLGRRLLDGYGAWEWLAAHLLFKTCVEMTPVTFACTLHTLQIVVRVCRTRIPSTRNIRRRKNKNCTNNSTNRSANLLPDPACGPPDDFPHSLQLNWSIFRCTNFDDSLFFSSSSFTRICLYSLFFVSCEYAVELKLTHTRLFGLYC